jgi:DNA-binding NarL/FixJ family response regulator
MFQRGWFHLDVRRTELLPELLPIVRQYGPARVLPLAAPVVRELSEDARFAGLIVQVGPDSLGWLDRLHSSAPGLPVLALLDRGDLTNINHLQARGVSTAVLPLVGANITNFVQRALTNSFVPCDRVSSTIAHLAETRALTAREVQLVSYCLGDEPRARVRRRLGITENTLKSQIRGLLRKCGERNLDALAKNLLRSALVAPGSQLSIPIDLPDIANASDNTRPSLSMVAVRAQLSAAAVH